MTLDRSTHPCFSVKAKGHYGRVHLPVAPACNVQCNFCNRKFDCANETRPGVCSTLLTPQQAVEYTGRVLEKAPHISVVGIAGPGDPFANAPKTLETLRLVRERFPQLLFCVASNGLEMPEHLDALAELNVSHCTVTVNAVEPEIAGNIYSWLRYKRHMYRGREAGEILLDRQTAAIRGLHARGITVKVNTIVIPSINDRHVKDIAEYVAALGADMLNCIPMYPTKETVFEEFPEPTQAEMFAIRERAEMFLPQMRHCTRCRADAVGLLGQEPSDSLKNALLACAGLPPVQSDSARRHVAVASWEGALVNQHLGEATRLWIFEQNAGTFRQVETRDAPAPGGGNQRWEALAELLSDCRAILASGIGGSPRAVLETTGIRIIEMEGLIEEGLKAVYSDIPLHPALARKFAGCSSGGGCRGTGTGCG